jgi:hypothetical protein
MSQPGDPNSESRQVWTDQDSRQRFEHELIDRKTTWWLTSQAILFAAYGVTLRSDTVTEDDKFRQVVAAAGLASAIVTSIGVSALIRSKFLSWKFYAASYAKEEHHLPPPYEGHLLPWGVKTSNTLVTLMPDVALPLIFGGAWLWLLS